YQCFWQSRSRCSGKRPSIHARDAFNGYGCYGSECATCFQWIGIRRRHHCADGWLLECHRRSQARWAADRNQAIPDECQMINKLIEVSIRNRWVVLVLYALLAVWGYWAMLKTPVDAIPDLSENQVIVFSDWPGRSPQEVEDQVTYPLTVNLQGLPNVRTVRSSSAFGFSMINIIFEENVDVY